MTREELKSEAIDLAVAYLIRAGFKNASFLQAYALKKAAHWVMQQDAGSISALFSDTFEMMVILQKSKINFEEAYEDYQALKEKKARRIAERILAAG
jgi:hypothetical protein